MRFSRCVALRLYTRADVVDALVDFESIQMAWLIDLYLCSLSVPPISSLHLRRTRQILGPYHGSVCEALYHRYQRRNLSVVNCIPLTAQISFVQYFEKSFQSSCTSQRFRSQPARIWVGQVKVTTDIIRLVLDIKTYEVSLLSEIEGQRNVEVVKWE